MTTKRPRGATRRPAARPLGTLLALILALAVWSPVFPAQGRADASPRGAMRAFLAAAGRGDFDAAGRYLDLSDIPEAVRAEGAATLAWKLKVVLDQQLWVDLGRLSSEPAGERSDGEADYDTVGTIDLRGHAVDVLLERVSDGDGRGVWKISSSTVARIPALYQAFGYGALGRILPDLFFEAQFLRIQLWQWIGLLLLVPLAWIASWFGTMLLRRFLRPIVRHTHTSIDDRLVDRLSSPARLLLAIGIFSLSTLALHLAVPVRDFLGESAKAAVLLAVAWVVLRTIDVVAGAARSRLEAANRRAVVSVVPLGRRTAKVVVAGLAGLAMLQTFGFNVTGLLAGLGIGGLAVALAAQPSLENLFGGVSLISDQPVRVGDFCRFGDRVGTVEDVGLRSTKVRTLDRTVVSVPNSEFAKLQLENYTRRDLIKLRAQLGLRYETTPDQLRYVLLELRKLLITHPRVSLEPFWRVRFVGFGAYSLDVELWAYAKTTDYGEFLGIQEDILLRVMEIVERSGTGFAFPSQTTYLGRDGGLDERAAKAAAKQLHEQWGNRDWPFPDFDDEEIARLRDSLAPLPSSRAAGDGTGVTRGR
jgi:MscS family membrane protein